MQIGTVTLGRIPRVIVALNDVRLKENLEKARELKIDLVEARIDLLEKINEESVKLFLDTIANYGFYTVSTLRPSWEGGNFSGSETERLKLFEKIVKHPATGAVDIELRSEILLDVKTLVKKEHKVLIVSYHDFEKTPVEEEIEEIFHKAVEVGADVVKLAFTGKEKKDVARVCCTISKFNHPKIFMVMGESGKFTRVVGFSFGSLLTYTFFGKPVAPGQIEAEKLIKLLCEFYPEFEKEKIRYNLSS
ncbi:type I 3-dehydroquinate dehydratase [Desulfurobacterium thermolithotrophum]|uniref:type I 3-dehydroquinate dehydratase n=1 Tax=Desulfurobacterium thermolithotrophum TaxID=64160 RepID=UPI0013D861C3|nr:type I 3-dehydroquinate dehydratase [Desulfurobacterium thermolithotrophum]